MSKFTEQQIAFARKRKVARLRDVLQMDTSEATFYCWKRRYSGAAA
jgi:hypothetical protein